MAVYRVERTRDYTVMSNYHLRDANLTLKAKGLLSMMLSLPDEWNYSTRGLASICKEGVDSIGKTIRELEKAGYIVRRQLRGANGRITDTEYVIYEQPQNPDAPPAPDTRTPDQPDGGAEERAAQTGSVPEAQTPQNQEPVTDTQSPRPVHPDTAPSDTEEPDTAAPDAEGPDTAFPHTDFPYVVEPDMAEPGTEKPAELNIKQSSTKKSNTHRAKKDSFFPSAAQSAEGRAEIAQKRAEIKAQIEYDFIVDMFNRDQIDEFVEIMLEVAMTRSPTIKIGREAEYPTAFVQDRFERIDASHIQRVLEAIEDNTTRVWNTKAYLLATLFNVTSTTGNHYAMLVNHDMRGLRPGM